ncbi:MAG TPA: hypothetical protein VHZ51_02845 [Ktedonobacteraceae bacterium]|jgi:hypothetical protein|nr:hypothetical protein [Ktedonobacteraceae bacterium]
MNANDIERYLSLLGEELQAIGVQEPIQLLLVGGGYMLTQIGNRSLTGDIDALWLYPEDYSSSELYRLFEGAVGFVASDEHLDAGWLNTHIGDFMRSAGPLPKMKLWKKFDVVHVYLPPRDFILAYKLLASRRKDRGDIAALCTQLRINTRNKAQKVLDKYIRREVQEINDVPAKLGDIFKK